MRGRLGNPLTPMATPEWNTPCLSSVYALSKYDQERLCQLMGRNYGMSTVALRFFHVYGPDQALSNPYTGVLSNFASRLLNDQPPVIFEDGEQRRDPISVLTWRVPAAWRLRFRKLAGWLDGQVAIDRGGEARAELAARGLMV